MDRRLASGVCLCNTTTTTSMKDLLVKAARPCEWCQAFVVLMIHAALRLASKQTPKPRTKT
eukprot:1901600-Amphidinium_carterae.1